jgi:hypothetical protein
MTFHVDSDMYNRNVFMQKMRLIDFNTRKILLLLVLLISGLVSVRAQDDDRQFKVFIGSDKLTFIEGEPVEISAVIKNSDNRTLSFSVYDVNYTTFQPVVYGMDGREAETIVQYRQMNRSTQDVLQYIEPRKSVISPDEKIVKRVSVSDYYKLEPGKEYRIRLFFLPDAKIPDVIKSENSLVIRIAPLEREVDESIKLSRKYSGTITPGEVIMLCLSAEKSRNWQNMMKYINLEKYVNAYPDYGMEFNAANEAVKRKVLRDFTIFLSTPRNDYIVDFDIKSESILDNRKTAYVETRVIRNSAPKPYVYLYKYTLERTGGSWLITGIDATVSKERIIAK